MISARNLLTWPRKKSSLAWSLAVITSASAGLFLGSDHIAQSDISKYNAILAQNERVPGEVVVRLSPQGISNFSAMSVDAMFQADKFDLTAKAFETNQEFYLVKLKSDAQTAEFLEAAAKNPSIKYAEPNYIYRITGHRDRDISAQDATANPDEVIPNNPELDKLWGMRNVGQKDADGTVGKVGADIGATKAWKLATGNKNILVAIIDTGVDYTHPKLAANMFINQGEYGNGKESNGIDDDGNGFVDDWHGWNFAGVSTNNPLDDNEHGTHVAGTIGAKGNDGVTITGVNWDASIMGVKFLTAEGSGSLADAVKAIQYATLMGAKVMNNSWGGGGFSQTMMDAIVAAKAKGLLFVAAAGNDADNADSNPHYPAGYQVDNVISVAATTITDSLATFSTYGKRTVHIAAPGHKIYSTVPKGGYATFSGTSMATPHTTGAAALVWGANPTLGYADIKDRLLRSRDPVPGLARKVSTGGRLNVYNALAGIYPPSPEPAESAWVDFPLDKPVESEHPYKDNSNVEFVINGPANAKFIRVVFSKIEMEQNYDFVKVYDSAGQEVDSISGAADNSSTYHAAGSVIKLKLTSDGSVSKWGFAVGKVQVVY